MGQVTESSQHVASATEARSGMTLVSAMIASALLITVVGGSLIAAMQARYLARAAAHQAHALQICRANLEALRYAYGYADPALSVGTHTNMPSTVPQIISVGGQVMQVAYAPSYTVAESTLGSNFCYKTVLFTVTWNEQSMGTQRPLSATMNTVIASVLNR